MAPLWVVSVEIAPHMQAFPLVSLSKVCQPLGPGAIGVTMSGTARLWSRVVGNQDDPATAKCAADRYNFLKRVAVLRRVNRRLRDVLAHKHRYLRLDIPSTVTGSAPRLVHYRSMEVSVETRDVLTRFLQKQHRGLPVKRKNSASSVAFRRSERQFHCSTSGGRCRCTEMKK